MSPQISIIIPVYKAEKHLRKCIDSILLQTVNNWELILVDDGSPDSSGKICDEYALQDSRIKVYHKTNGGVSSARNHGLKQSTGTYVTFIDSDDYVSSTYLEDFQIKNLCDNEVALVSQGIKQYFPEKDLYIERFKYRDSKLQVASNPSLLVEQDILANGCPVAKIFDLNIIKNNNLFFNESISLNEDHLFILDYLYYTTTIYTRSSVNYTYFCDFTIPTLTKVRHSAQDSFNAAISLFESFNMLKNKYSEINELFNVYAREFGPNQLIRASISTFTEKNSIAKFADVAVAFKSFNVDTNLLIFKDFYSKSYVYLINHHSNIYCFYLIQLMLNMINVLVSRLKYIVKYLVHVR